MNIEQLDGFFAALIAGPDVVPPNVGYLRVHGPWRGQRDLGATHAEARRDHCADGGRHRRSLPIL